MNDARTADLGGGVELVLVPVKAGSFQMGAASEISARPVRAVRISRDFWMGETEVTQRQYQQLMGNNPSHFKGDDLPVERVSWHDAVKFCDELTKRERAAGRIPRGYAYRLPTEAEWEYAARGGANGRNTQYAGSDNLDTVAWYDGNNGGGTKKVGTKEANNLGLHDMSGNVAEWVYDWHQGNYNGLAATDPIGPVSGSSRVTRGGSWAHPWTRIFRVGYRMSCVPSAAIVTLGFRAVLAAPVQ